MKGLHRQSSVLSALAKYNIVSGSMIDTISADFIGQNKPLIRYIVEDKKLNAESIASVLSLSFGYPLIDLANFDTTLIPDGIRNEKLIRKHNALPLFLRGKVLFVAMSDPTNLDALEEIQFNTGFSTELVLANQKSLAECIEKILEEDSDALDISDIDAEELAGIDVQDEHQEEDNTTSGDKEDAPIVVYINKILLDAIRKGASDLHFEPYEKSYRIRFRIDGILTEVAKPPVSLASRMSARLKVMSKLDIAERRVPQDGRIKLALSKKKSIDFRVSTLPTMWGEKVVMRILDSSSAMLGIDMLGYAPAQKKIYMEALAQPQGMILVTGPTGSGKTVSLYTGLNILNTDERNISTAEDPVEINLEGINQVQINTRAGLTFPGALRSFLRQDPDIVMVGEIRDLETAEIAIKAAQTGHLVLSTLHTNSAATTVTRLLEIGIAPYLVNTSLLAVLAQRLVRKNCPECTEEETIPDAIRKSLGIANEEKFYKGKGCSHCYQTGYFGRAAVYELMVIDANIRQNISDRPNADLLEQLAVQNGMVPLTQMALSLARDKITSLEEVHRVKLY